MYEALLLFSIYYFSHTNCGLVDFTFPEMEPCVFAMLDVKPVIADNCSLPHVCIDTNRSCDIISNTMNIHTSLRPARSLGESNS